MSASDFAPLREPTPEQIIDTLREVRWSVVMDCLRHETLTEHGRWVLENAPDVVARLLREHAEMTHRLTPGTSGTLSTPPTEQDDGN